MKTPFWKDPHFWSAVAAFALGVALRHAPPQWQQDLIELYGALVAAGIIAARRQVGTQLSLAAPPVGEEVDA